MKIKSILAGAAIALAASIGTASAEDAKFITLKGISVIPMPASDMEAVVGAADLLFTSDFMAAKPTEACPVVCIVAMPEQSGAFNSAVGRIIGLDWVDENNLAGRPGIRWDDL